MRTQLIFVQRKLFLIAAFISCVFLLIPQAYSVQFCFTGQDFKQAEPFAFLGPAFPGGPPKSAVFLSMKELSNGDHLEITLLPRSELWMSQSQGSGNRLVASSPIIVEKKSNSVRITGDVIRNTERQQTVFSPMVSNERELVKAICFAERGGGYEQVDCTQIVEKVCFTSGKNEQLVGPSFTTKYPSNTFESVDPASVGEAELVCKTFANYEEEYKNGPFTSKATWLDVRFLKRLKGSQEITLLSRGGNTVATLMKSTGAESGGAHLARGLKFPLTIKDGRVYGAMQDSESPLMCPGDECSFRIACTTADGLADCRDRIKFICSPPSLWRQWSTRASMPDPSSGYPVSDAQVELESVVELPTKGASLEQSLASVGTQAKQQEDSMEDLLRINERQEEQQRRIKELNKQESNTSLAKKLKKSRGQFLALNRWDDTSLIERRINKQRDRIQKLYMKPGGMPFYPGYAPSVYYHPRDTIVVEPGTGVKVGPNVGRMYSKEHSSGNRYDAVSRIN